jgi:DNA polymerase III subunit delta'
MQIKPSENNKLYEMDKYFYEIINLYEHHKMPNKILLSGKKGIGKSTLAYHIVNYILSKDEDNSYEKKNLIINNENKSFKLLINKSHPNFYLIDLVDEKKNIDVAQVRKMISFTNKSSFNDTPKLILIDNIENLNNSSTNALLKVIEEPNNNIFFLLIHNNETKILPTLKSRCLTFRISFSFDEVVNISNKLINENIFDLINYDLISYYNTPGEIINLLNFAAEKKIDLKSHTLVEFLELLIDKGYYKKNSFVKKLLISFIELYFLKEYKHRLSKDSLLNTYHNFLDKIHNTEKFNLDDESLFMEFKSKLLNG